MPSVSSIISRCGCGPALDRYTDFIKDDPEVLPMFREAMKGKGNQHTCKGRNATPPEKDRGKAYTLSRLQKDNPEAAS